MGVNNFLCKIEDNDIYMINIKLIIYFLSCVRKLLKICTIIKKCCKQSPRPNSKVFLIETFLFYL